MGGHIERTQITHKKWPSAPKERASGEKHSFVFPCASSIYMRQQHLRSSASKCKTGWAHIEPQNWIRPFLNKVYGACELFWQKSIKVVMGWLSGRGTEELMTSSPQLKKPSTLPPTPSLQNIWYFWPQALNRGSLACRGCEKCQGLKFPGQNSCRSQPDDVNLFYSVVWQNILHSSRITFRLDFYILKVVFQNI